MNLLDLYEGREPYQQAIDKLEARRIEDLEAKMDDCARRGDKEGFQKCKAERDSYYRVKMDEGSMKQWLWNEAERMDRDAFVGNADEYGMTAEEAAEWWDSINGPLDEDNARVDPILIKALNRMPDNLNSHGEVLNACYDAYAMELGKMEMKSQYGTTQAYIPQLMKLYKDKYGLTFNEAGIGQDLVTPQQRVQQSTPQKQTPVQKVGSTVKHAAKWVAGQGGPGKEGPTYEEAELDEQTSPVNTAKLVWAQIAKAVNSNVDVATITWPNGESQKLTRNQLWHIDQKARTMSRQARNQFALKTFVDVNNLMYYLGTLKAVKPRPQLRPEVDPSQPSLDLPKPTLEDSKKKR